VAAGVSVEEARADHEREALANLEPCDYETGLAWCRLALSRYGGVDALDEIPLEDAGPCDDCQAIVDFALCRQHAMSRLRVRAGLATNSGMNPESLRNQPPPADPHAWTVTNAGRYTTPELRTAFHHWQLDPDQAVELVDLAADLAREHEGAVA
jgi:hypothetical protein